jgi:hypothetical protein
MDGWYDIDGNQVVMPRQLSALQGSNHRNLNNVDLNLDDNDDETQPVQQQLNEVTNDELAESAEYEDLWDKLCNSITIHGIYFIGESRTWIGTILWALIVFTGIFGAAVIIYDSYVFWGDHPVLTTIKQIPIETVHFPSITICPLDGTE